MSRFLLVLVVLAISAVSSLARPGENGGGVRKPPVTEGMGGTSQKIAQSGEMGAPVGLSMDRRNAIKPGQGTHPHVIKQQNSIFIRINFVP